MAEPIVFIIVCSIAVFEILGEIVAKRIKNYRESQISLENQILPEVLDRIEREESNIQQVINGRRKEDKIIEEYPIELLEPHVSSLKELRRFSQLADRLETELSRNKELPAGQKEFRELQEVLSEIKSLAKSPQTNNRLWLLWLYLMLVMINGVFAVCKLQLPFPKESIEAGDNFPVINVELP